MLRVGPAPKGSWKDRHVDTRKVKLDCQKGSLPRLRARQSRTISKGSTGRARRATGPGSLGERRPQVWAFGLGGAVCGAVAPIRRTVEPGKGRRGRGGRGRRVRAQVFRIPRGRGCGGSAGLYKRVRGVALFAACCNSRTHVPARPSPPQPHGVRAGKSHRRLSAGAGRGCVPDSHS